MTKNSSPYFFLEVISPFFYLILLTKSFEILEQYINIEQSIYSFDLISFQRK